ncbi:hypothetical protein [Marinicellulosiphila megalodicopiae]|uniref:hypothetical protein n=1 Tax=Marinicellulosiphila megalodicopiae TaxID=2724896 RepID=UPI003BB1F6DB
MKKTLFILLTITSTLGFAGPEPSKTFFGNAFKLNTDLFAWANALNAEIEVITQPNLTAGLGLKLGGFGSHLVANGRYYFNEAQQESPFLRSFISLPLLTGGEVGYGASAGYQFVFDRKYFASGQLGFVRDFEFDAEITVGISF